MIKGGLLALAVFAVFWLALWVGRAERGKPGRWAPFDMREPRPRQATATTVRGRRVRPVRRRLPR